jgi:deoxyribonuclease V
VASVFDQGRLAEKSAYAGICSLPYLSGLFYLREGPFVVETVRRLRVRPQLLCFDAHGAAHPRSAGLATMCGMVLGIPSVGMAKSLLVGRVMPDGGDLAKVVHNGKTVGFAVQTDGITRYWSAGYSVGLGELKSLIRRYAGVCLRAMSESDRTARGQIRVG